MARFKSCDISQGQFLTVNLYDQLLPGTFEWALGYLVDRADLSLFEQNYQNDAMGATAYAPKALLKIILYCYSLGILSSRAMERACKSNITVKALSGDSEPDHATIAAFVSAHKEAVSGLFTQVLVQCNELDLITGEMFAFDGCKLPSNASKEWSGTIEGFKKKREKLKNQIERLLERHRKLDGDERAKKTQEPFEKTMGDDRERRQRHVERLEEKLQKIDAFLEEATPRKGAGTEEVQSNITDNESARIKGPHGYIQGYNGVAAADGGHQVIISAEVVGSVSESVVFPAMLDDVQETMRTITGRKRPLRKAIGLADTGFFSEENLQEAKARGIEVVIPDPQFRQRDPDFADRNEGKGEKRYTAEDFIYDKRTKTYTCPAGKTLRHKGKVKLRNNEGDKYKASSADCKSCAHIDRCIAKRAGKSPKSPARALYIVESKYAENLSAKMRDKIDDPAYREIYARRQQIIEPVFSDITYCKKMNRFTLRTKEKVGIQWKLYCIVHNIGKCVRALVNKREV